MTNVQGKFCDTAFSANRTNEGWSIQVVDSLTGKINNHLADDQEFGAIMLLAITGGTLVEKRLKSRKTAFRMCDAVWRYVQLWMGIVF